MNRVIIAVMLAVAGLLVFGVVMMVSLSGHVAATSHSQSLVATGLVRNQLVWIGIGLVLMWEVSRVDHRRWRQIAFPFAGMVFALLSAEWIWKWKAERALADEWVKKSRRRIWASHFI